MTKAPSVCIGCEERPIRLDGEHVSILEGITDQLLYCELCATDCAAGKWEGNPDEDDE